jgi:serine/threonine-protein kinase HipA
MAPLYDAVTTRVFPRLKQDRMALKLNGKDDQLRRADFRALAATAGLRAAEADAAIDDMIERTKQMADRITFPKVPYYGPEGEAMAAKKLKLRRTRIESLG